MKGFENIPVRFFIYSDEEGDDEFAVVEIVEVDEAEFLEAGGDIIYERHTVRENGCSQICLTKRNGF